MHAPSPNQTTSTGATGHAGRVTARGRRAEPRTPVARAAPVRRRAAHGERVDLDRLYMAEMGQSSVLSQEQEVELGKLIVQAERDILAAILEAPSGARTLERLAGSLADGTLDIRDVLLNPDEEGLDLESMRKRIVAALHNATRADAHARAQTVEALADARIDGELAVELADGVDRYGTPADRVARNDIARARRALRRAKDRLILGNLRLVLLFARRYEGRGISLLDLVQEGNIGLLRAADKFDHRRGVRFSTYAAWWIKQALQRSLLDRVLRLPVHVADDRRRIGRTRAVFAARKGREPTAEEVASMTGLAKGRVDAILAIVRQPSSLDAPVGDEGDATIGDFVANPSAGPDEVASQHALSGQLEGLLEALTPREQQVLRMRFGLGYPREHTLEEVGQALTLTRERIRQIERSALDKLRFRGTGLGLRSYLTG